MKNNSLLITQSPNANQLFSDASETAMAHDKVLWASHAVWWGSIVAELGDNLKSAATNESKDADFFTVVIMILLVTLTLPFWTPFVILRNLTTKCIVTRRSIELQTGLFFKDLDSIRMSDVQNIEMRSAMFGTAMVTVRASGSEIFLRRVARCKQLRALVENLTTQQS